MHNRDRIEKVSPLLVRVVGPSLILDKIHMNTGQRNVHGRTIYRGPRGGQYVLSATGQKIRSFRVAPPSLLEGFTRTHFKDDQHHIYRKNSSGRHYAVRVEPNGRPKQPLNARAIALGKYVTNERTGVRKTLREHLAPAPPPHRKLTRMFQLGNKWIAKGGAVYKRNGRLYDFGNFSARKIRNVLANVYRQNPSHLSKSAIPYLNPTNDPAPARLRLRRPTWAVHASGDPLFKAQLHFDRYGKLYYVTLNGRKVNIRKASGPLRVPSENRYQMIQREVARRATNFPRLTTNRPSHVLVDNMLNQIYRGGRGQNVNASRYTATERQVLIEQLKGSIAFFKQKREAKKLEAARATDRSVAAAAIERVGYYDDAVRAYTRGLRALQPLTGQVPNAYRRAAASPNRWSPAPANENFNALYLPLEAPYVSVKTPGVTKTIYLTPFSLRGLIRNAARVNIPEANLPNWLRMARNKFPDEPLFRHPLDSSKNVTPGHIRFTRS